ncbi:flagellar hook-associated protein FlgK [Sagittula salina]|uniref:Flagellar hook-associated protein 1 n=1 Tax=Sagittula salina TaxID=2820268 RepID=A0A940MR83_9RHOB|nr:flagellar hook-associated protein FlgK [Sagittula salina]MBP0483331.1 flagellar hook-associated protein FlgK [Sagittula salina]
MSLSGALNTAFGGLKVNSRAANVVSTNISNATNEAYGRRELGVSALGDNGTRGGVLATGVIRHTDPVLLADRMVSDARMANSNDMHAFAKRIEDLVGESGTSGSLTDRVTAFENALLSAASNPAATQRLELVATTAQDLTTAINNLSSEVQEARQIADDSIATQVERLNAGIDRLHSINDVMIKAGVSGVETASILDERQAILNEISSIVPLRVVERARGDIALFTRGGGVLLDGPGFEVGFTPTGSIDASTTLSGGQLSGLTLNGKPVSSGSGGLFAGGSLAAQFQIRDTEAVARQAELDGIARDLIERLGPGGPDSTLGPTDAGLFTDNGVAFVATNETGLAVRIAINPLVAPASGGSWRLRDGLGAATPGEVGDSALIQGIADALGTAALPSSGALPGIARSFVHHASQFASAAVGERVRTENALSFQTAQNTTLKELELSKGVDTDHELQQLMLVEQHYTANAKVISTVDGLFERLLSI